MGRSTSAGSLTSISCHSASTGASIQPYWGSSGFPRKFGLRGNGCILRADWANRLMCGWIEIDYIILHHTKSHDTGTFFVDVRSPRLYRVASGSIARYRTSGNPIRRKASPKMSKAMEYCPRIREVLGDQIDATFSHACIGNLQP